MQSAYKLFKTRGEGFRPGEGHTYFITLGNEEHYYHFRPQVSRWWTLGDNTQWRHFINLAKVYDNEPVEASELEAVIVSGTERFNHIKKVVQNDIEKRYYEVL